MAKIIDRIAARFGARMIGQVPAFGGGAFGAARLAKAIDTLQARPVPGQCERDRAGGSDASPMQIAAQISEDSLSGVAER